MILQNKKFIDSVTNCVSLLLRLLSTTFNSSSTFRSKKFTAEPPISSELKIIENAEKKFLESKCNNFWLFRN